MPNLNSIKLRLKSLFSWTIINLNKQTVVEIDVSKILSSIDEDLPIGEVEQINLPKLKKLRISSDFDKAASILLIKGGAQTLETLDLHASMFGDNNFNEVGQINLPKLKILKMHQLDKAASISLIKGGAQTLETLDCVFI